MRRHVYLTARRPGPLPSSEVAIDGKSYAVDVLVHKFSAFGETTFGEFYDAVLTDFPSPAI